MKLTDLFLLISLLVALVAFLNQEERLFVKNKFSKVNIIFLILIFIYLHFLLYFTWWSSKIPVIKIFIIKGFPTPETWVYIIALSSIAWLLYKIFKAPFPSENHNKLILFYQRLFEKKESNTIVNYIERFNYIDVKKYLCGHRNCFNKALFEEIISDDTFLYDSSAYNFCLLEIVLKNRQEADDNQIFFRNFFLAQLNSRGSYLNRKLNSEYFGNDIFQQDKNIKQLVTIISFFDNDSFLEGLNKNIKDSISHFENLMNFNYYLIIQNKDNFSVSINNINSLFFSEIKKHKLEDELIIFFDNLFLFLQEIRDNSILFSSTLKSIIELLYLLNENGKIVTLSFTKTIFFLFKTNNNLIKDLLIGTITECLKNKIYKDIRHDVYFCYMSNIYGIEETSEEKTIFEDRIINIIADY